MAKRRKRERKMSARRSSAAPAPRPSRNYPRRNYGNASKVATNKEIEPNMATISCLIKIEPDDPEPICTTSTKGRGRGRPKKTNVSSNIDKLESFLDNQGQQLFYPQEDVWAGTNDLNTASDSHPASLPPSRRKSLRLQNQHAERMSSPPDKVTKKPAPKRTRKRNSATPTTIQTHSVEAPGVVMLELLKVSDEPPRDDEHPGSSQETDFGLFLSEKQNVDQGGTETGITSSQFQDTIAAIKAEPESPLRSMIDEQEAPMTRRMTRGSRAMVNHSNVFIPDDMGFNQTNFTFLDDMEFGGTITATQNDAICLSRGDGTSTNLNVQQTVIPSGSEIIPYRIPHSKNLEKYVSLPPSEQVLRLARDLDNQIKIYNVLHETVVSYKTFQNTLIKENATLRQSSMKYQEIAENEKKRAEDVWKKLDMTRLYNKANEEGAEQRHFLSERYSSAIEKIKRECHQRLKDIELDRNKLAKENQVLNRKLSKVMKKSKSKAMKVQKGLVSSLVRVVGRFLKDVDPQAMKMNIGDMVSKLCGDNGGKVFSQCFEGEKWKPEDDLVNLICDWLLETGMDQNEIERDEADDEPPTKRVKIDEVVIAKINEIPPEVSSVSNEDDSDEEDEDFEEVHGGGGMSTLRSRFAQDIQEIRPVGEGVMCEKMRLEKQWKGQMTKGKNKESDSVRTSSAPNSSLKSNYKMEDLFGEDSNDNVPSPSGTHREDFNFDKLKRCGDESSTISSSDEDEEQPHNVEMGKNKVDNIKPSAEMKKDIYAMLSNELELSDSSDDDESMEGSTRMEGSIGVEESTGTEESTGMEESASVEGVGSEMSDFISPASPVGTLDEDGVGENKCVTFDGALYRALNVMVNTPIEDLFNNSTILQFSFTHTTQEIASAIFVLITNTGSSHLQAEMIKPAAVTECPIIPRFASLLAVMRDLMMTYPVKYQDLFPGLCRVFCEKITGVGGEKLLGNEKLLAHVGRFFGAALKLCEGVDIEGIVVSVGGVKGPFLYPLLYGMLCSDSTGVLNFIQGVSRWENLDLWVRGVLMTIMRGPSFTHSKWRGTLVGFLKTLGVASVVPVDLGFEEYLLGMLKEVAGIESERALRKGGRVIALMMGQIGWPWLKKSAEGLFREYEGLWKNSAISDGAFGEAILKGVGGAIAWMRKDNTPEDLTDVKQLLTRYQDAEYPKIIQDAAASTLKLLASVVLRSPGQPLQYWTYERTDGGGRVKEARGNKRKSAEKRKRQKINRKMRKPQGENEDSTRRQPSLPKTFRR